MLSIRRYFKTRVLGAFESDLQNLDAEIKSQLKLSQFKGKQNEFRMFYRPESNLAVIGLGNKDKSTPESIRSAVCYINSALQQ